jgi:hypothetical protein
MFKTDYLMQWIGSAHLYTQEMCSVLFIIKYTFQIFFTEGDHILHIPYELHSISFINYNYLKVLHH